MALLRPGARTGTDRGNLLIDWLLAAALLGLILAGVTRFSLRELERAEINAAAIELSGWLEVIQRASMRLPAANDALGADAEVDAGCVVTFTAAPDGVAPGEVIATVRPKQVGLAPQLCNPEPEFRMPGTRHRGGGGAPARHVTTTLLDAGNGRGRVTFTPRGTVTNEQTLDLVIRHTGYSRAARCVRVNGITGLIELGHDNAGSEPRCPEESFTDLI